MVVGIRIVFACNLYGARATEGKIYKAMTTFTRCSLTPRKTGLFLSYMFLMIETNDVYPKIV